MIVIGTDMVTTPFSDDCTNQLTVRSYFGRIIHNFGTNGQIEVYEEVSFWSNLMPNPILRLLYKSADLKEDHSITLTHLDTTLQTLTHLDTP